MLLLIFTIFIRIERMMNMLKKRVLSVLLAAAMLRSVGIPTQIVFGNFEGAWHAWLSTCVKEGEWLLLDPTTGQIGEADTYIPEMKY